MNEIDASLQKLLIGNQKSDKAVDEVEADEVSTMLRSRSGSVFCEEHKKFGNPFIFKQGS